MVREMADNVLSQQRSKLYQRLLADEYHMLQPARETLEKMDDAERELLDTG
jgi:hypothetical protein